MCANVGTYYYKELSEYTKLELSALLAQADVSDEGLNNIGAAFHTPQIATPSEYCSGEMLAVHEKVVMDALYASLERFQSVLPQDCVGHVLLSAKKRMSFETFVTILCSVSEVHAGVVQEILGILAQAVFLVMFKSQKIDACGIHNKGPSHAAMIDSFSQALLDGGVLFCKIKAEVRAELLAGASRL